MPKVLVDRAAVEELVEAYVGRFVRADLLAHIRFLPTYTGTADEVAPEKVARTHRPVLAFGYGVWHLPNVGRVELQGECGSKSRGMAVRRRQQGLVTCIRCLKQIPFLANPPGGPLDAEEQEMIRLNDANPQGTKSKDAVMLKKFVESRSSANGRGR